MILADRHRVLPSARDSTYLAGETLLVVSQLWGYQRAFTEASKRGESASGSNSNLGNCWK